MNWNPPDPWVILGRIGKPVGLDGAVRVWPEADLGEIFENQVPLASWSYWNGKIQELRMEAAREDAHGWVVKWEGYDVRESTAALRNAWVVAKREELPEPGEGMVYSSDLLGSTVRTRDGRELGVVGELIDCFANAVIGVKTAEGKEFLVPLTPEVDAKFEKSGDPETPSLVWVNLPQGMEEATQTPLGEEKQHRTNWPRSRGRRKAKQSGARPASQD